MSGTPESGHVVETTTRRRILPADRINAPFDFWDYVEKLKPEDASRHILYVYRDDPPPTMQVGKFVYSDASGWGEVPWNDREEAEAIIAQRWGGRIFRVMVKDRSQRMGVGKIHVNAPPKALTPLPPEQPAYPAMSSYGGGPMVMPVNTHSYPSNPYDPTARVAETAIHTMANQEKQAVEIGISALTQAANVIKSFSERPPTPQPQDDLAKQIMAVMIQRMMVDPFENLTKMMTLMQTMQSAATPNGPLNPVMQKFLDVAADRVFNPPTPSGPAVSMGAELVRTLPSIAQYITQGMADYARIMEAQRDTIAMQRGAIPGQLPQSQQRPTTPAPQPNPPLPAQPNGGTNAMFDPMLFIEGKIVEILNEPESAEWAAEEAIQFLDRMDANIVPQLCAQGEPGLMALFQTRPTLKPATTNLPRLTEFIKVFLKLAQENAPENLPEQKPN